MTRRERHVLTCRLTEIEVQLGALYELRVVAGPPDRVEQALLDEKYEIEFLLGDDWIERSDSAY